MFTLHLAYLKCRLYIKLKVKIVIIYVETGHALSLQNKKTIGQNRFQNIGENTISSIIGGYKSAVTKHINRLNFQFIWQSRFYDHIIRNDGEYQRVKEYIINNPKKWDEDKFYK